MLDRPPARGENDDRRELDCGGATAFLRRLSSDLADIAMPVAVVVASRDDPSKIEMVNPASATSIVPVTVCWGLSVSPPVLVMAMLGATVSRV